MSIVGRLCSHRAATLSRDLAHLARGAGGGWRLHCGLPPAAPPHRRCYLLRVIRGLITLVVVGVLVFFGATVKLGKRTFFGHVSAIWNTQEAKDMREGVGEKAGPVVDKIERGVKAGVKEATKDEAGAGSGSVKVIDAGVVHP